VHAPALPDSCVTDHGAGSRADESLRSTSGRVRRHAPHVRWIDMPEPLTTAEWPRDQSSFSVRHRREVRRPSMRPTVTRVGDIDPANVYRGPTHGSGNCAPRFSARLLFIVIRDVGSSYVGACHVGPKMEYPDSRAGSVSVRAARNFPARDARPRERCPRPASHPPSTWILVPCEFGGHFWWSESTPPLRSLYSRNAGRRCERPYVSQPGARKHDTTKFSLRRYFS
jgi:hypothetical protein